jgi:hypothetical protein
MPCVRLDKEELAALQSAHPRLPVEYLQYLSEVGWGEAESGWMIYSGPINPQEVYGDQFSVSELVLLGDDMQGYCLAYDLASASYVEIDPRGSAEPIRDTSPFEQFVRSR